MPDEIGQFKDQVEKLHKEVKAFQGHEATVELVYVILKNLAVLLSIAAAVVKPEAKLIATIITIASRVINFLLKEK